MLPAWSTTSSSCNPANRDAWASADRDPMRVQDALGLRRRAGGEDEIGGIVRRRRRVVGRRGLGGEFSRLPPIQNLQMGKERALMLVGVADKDRRRPRIDGERQRLLHGQHEGSGLGDAADRRRREEGEHEIDVVGGADDDAVANPLYSPRELNHQLDDSGAEAIVVLENFAQTLEKAIGGTKARVVVVTGVGDLLGGVRGLMTNFALRHIRRAVPAWRLLEAVRFNRALSLGRLQRVEFAPVEPDDIAFLQYTGGTTGVPKGAMLTHRNMIANLEQVHAWVGSSLGSADEVFVTALPLYHVFSLTVNCLAPLMVGANNLLIPNPRDVRAFVKALRRTPFTAISGVNTLFNTLLGEPGFLRLDFSRLHLAIAGGMAVQRAVAERWKKVTGKPLIEGYGLTETSPIVTANPLTIEDYTGAVGLPMPSTDISIRDRDGRGVPLGEPGELCVKGPQVMAGYWMRPDETAQAMTEDGYLRTGDIARVDERGYVTIVDRRKDMIIVSGFNVYPNEIEDVVITHPGVYEVGAVGVPDMKSGEAVKIVVVRKDATLTEVDLIAYCRKSLAGYKTPRIVEFRDALPRTPIGKILRRELRDKVEVDRSSCPLAGEGSGVRALRRARSVELRHLGDREREFRRPRETVDLRDRSGAGDRRGHARLRDHPGEGDLGGFRLMARGDRIERVENAEPARVQIGLHAAAARALRQVVRTAVLAAQKPLGQAEIGDDSDLLAPAEVPEPALEFVPVGEIVLRLQHLVARPSARLRRCDRGF